MKVRIIRNYKQYKKGDVVHVRYTAAQELFSNGIATAQTDFTPDEYQTKEVSDGITERKRPYNRRRR